MSDHGAMPSSTCYSQLSYQWKERIWCRRNGYGNRKHVEEGKLFQCMKQGNEIQPRKLCVAVEMTLVQTQGVPREIWTISLCSKQITWILWVVTPMPPNTLWDTDTVMQRHRNDQVTAYISSCVPTAQLEVFHSTIVTSLGGYLSILVLTTLSNGTQRHI